LGAATAVGDILDDTSVVNLVATDSSIAMRSFLRWSCCRSRGGLGPLGVGRIVRVQATLMTVAVTMDSAPESSGPDLV
jgi:hypothetical protein